MDRLVAAAEWCLFRVYDPADLRDVTREAVIRVASIVAVAAVTVQVVWVAAVVFWLIDALCGG